MEVSNSTLYQHLFFIKHKIKKCLMKLVQKPVHFLERIWCFLHFKALMLSRNLESILPFPVSE